MAENELTQGSVPIDDRRSVGRMARSQTLGRDKIVALKANACVALACVMLVAISSNGFGGSGGSDTAGKVWAAYAQAQRQWQQELADFLSNHRPDLKKLILVSRDLQLALIERRSLEFHYLLATHPERIVRDQDISRFSNFHWTDEDSNTLKRSNPEYAAAAKRIEVLRQHNDGNPQWPALRAANQSLAKETDYQKIYGRFDQRVKAAEKLLKVSR